MTVYRDKEHFTTEGGNALGTLLTGGDSAAGTMLAVTDGVRHSQIRNILMKAFSPRMLHDIREGLRETVDGLLVAAIEKGECDFAEDVSGSVPLGAICDLLGVPRSDRKYLLSLTSRAWSSDHADAPPEDGWTAKSEILLYFADLAATRKHSDHDDVVSLLANSQIEGERLSDAELMANCYGLMIGGDETGRHAITGGLLALKQYPEQWKALRSGEAKLDTAVEEILRWTVPSIHGGRAATGDVVVNGQLIKAGEVVSVWISSGNFDGDVFADPYRFDLNRTPNKHLAFAHGAHTSAWGTTSPAWRSRRSSTGSTAWSPTSSRPAPRAGSTRRSCTACTPCRSPSSPTSAACPRADLPVPPRFAPRRSPRKVHP
ncbi:hypothetical protein STANM309S_03497 [Streptomyces tanashiensis]